MRVNKRQNHSLYVRCRCQHVYENILKRTELSRDVPDFHTDSEKAATERQRLDFTQEASNA